MSARDERLSRRVVTAAGAATLLWAGGCGSWSDSTRARAVVSQLAPGVEPAAGEGPAPDRTRLPAYRRARSARGVLRLSGSSAVAQAARAWASAFARMYPDVKVDVVSRSSSAAMADMRSDPSTIGMTSRPLNRAEREDYGASKGAPPLEVKVAIDALAVFVFKDNPLASITLAQLEGIFSAAPRRGGSIDHWGQLGLPEPWAARRIVPVGFSPGRGAFDLMRELVLGGGDFAADVSAEPVASSVVQAVGVEPGAIGYASASLRTARTRLVPLRRVVPAGTAGTASNAGTAVEGEAIAPDEAGAASGRYPLARFLYLHLGVGAAPGMRALQREFVRFVLSQEGQDLARANGAFAVPSSVAHDQLVGLTI
jgi:phosphate transport system substrate-binding protein